MSIIPTNTAPHPACSLCLGYFDRPSIYQRVTRSGVFFFGGVRSCAMSSLEVSHHLPDLASPPCPRLPSGQAPWGDHACARTQRRPVWGHHQVPRSCADCVGQTIYITKTRLSILLTTISFRYLIIYDKMC